VTDSKDAEMQTEGEAVEEQIGPPGTDAVEEVESTETPGEVEILREDLEEAKAQAAQYLDGWQRTQAEFANYKKRQEAERLQLTTLANAVLLRKLLPVVDDFERAMTSLPSSLQQLTWCEGIVLIKVKLDGILESEGVKRIDVEGQAFDPRFHEAVTYEEVEGYKDGQIIGELQRGYMLDERVLRPALVRVAKALVPQPEEAAQPEDDSDLAESKE